jgi:hypothetical protein
VQLAAFKTILSDPELRKESPYDLTPEQDREMYELIQTFSTQKVQVAYFFRRRTMRQLKRVAEILPSLPDDEFRESFIFSLGYYDRSVEMRLGVHYNLFRPILRVQGTEEQYQRWGVAADNFEILGCFGMTELGHSSHLRGSWSDQNTIFTFKILIFYCVGLETTAKFIKETQEFEINSPTVTSSKWWIGLAGEVHLFHVSFTNCMY